MTDLDGWPALATPRCSGYVLDRMRAVRNALGPAVDQPFDIRSDPSCASRVLANLITLGELTPLLERDGRRLYREILADYLDSAAATGLPDRLAAAVAAALAEPETAQEQLGVLAGRCLTESAWCTAVGAELHRRAAAACTRLLERTEQRYREVVRQSPETPRQGLPLADYDAIARHLTGGDATAILKPLVQVVGGYSKSTVVCELHRAGTAPRRVVVRSDDGNGFAASSVIDELPVLASMRRSAVSVPEPLWAGRTCPDAAAVLVVAYVDGAPFGGPASTAVRDRTLCRNMAAELARIHAAEPEPEPERSRPRSCVSRASANRAAAVAEVDREHAQLTEARQAMPLLDYAAAWLRNNTGSVSGRTTVIHGDYGPHNLLVAGSAIRAVLDWEFARPGNPAEDLCYSRLAVEQLGSWETFLDAYEAAGGRRPPAAELRYYTVLGLFRLGAMMLRTDDLFARSTSKQVRMAVSGAERLRPVLLALARHLDVAD